MRVLFSGMAASCPEHQFVFISGKRFGEDFIRASNQTTHVSGPASTMPLLLKYWYDVKLPGILRKTKADVLVCTDGFGSLGARAPQCVLVQDLAYLQEPALFSPAQRLFRKQQTGKSITKAAAIVVPAVLLKQELVRLLGADPKKIQVVPPFAPAIFRPLAEEEKIKIKERYTEGREYFLYSGLLHTEKKIMTLLKAFSVFKKRQQSNMKLVLAGSVGVRDPKLAAMLGHYKYRTDIVNLVAGEEERSRLTGAAWAWICPSPKEYFMVPALEALQCGVPVIVPSNSALEEITGQAGLIADSEKFEDLAEKMMRLYKDEKLRTELAEKGREVSLRFNPERSATLLREVIQNAFAKPAKEVG
jgi:glycosyltransferase involved in cell wall biosynthesis